VLTRLGEYTRIHFAVEESLMRLLGYPDLERHKEEHAELMTRLQELRQRFESGSSALDGDLMSLLKVWLTRHIMESDQQYAQFFVESGLSSRQRRRASRTRAWDHLHG
jgi:hemerythrin